MLSKAARFAVPFGATVTLLVPTVYAKECCDENKGYKEVNLGIYDDNRAERRRRIQQEAEKTELEKVVTKCREGIVPLKEKASSYAGDAEGFYNTYTKMIQDNVRYLRTTAPLEVRYATIAGASLFGFLLGLRRGMFRRLIYAGIGGAGAAAVIYPDEAKIVANEGVKSAKEFGNLAYNFIAGNGGDGSSATSNSSSSMDPCKKEPKCDASKVLDDACSKCKSGGYSCLDERKKRDECGCGTNNNNGGSFFATLSNLFGASESKSDIPNCDCNSALKDHLKSCCGYGEYPKLPTDYNTCNENKPVYKSVRFCDCGNCPKPEDLCGSIDNCKFTYDVKTLKCAPMPVFDVCDCKPTWLPAPNLNKTYTIPQGVKIVPISRGGRVYTNDDFAAPGVKNRNCPALKGRGCNTGEAAKKSGSGFFGKISSLFAKKEGQGQAKTSGSEGGGSSD